MKTEKQTNIFLFNFLFVKGNKLSTTWKIFRYLNMVFDSPNGKLFFVNIWYVHICEMGSTQTLI